NSDSRPLVSPDANPVIFLRNTGGCSIDYWRIQIDGTGEQQVSSEGLCVSANQVGHDWSPDGKEIVLVGSEPPGGYNFSIYKVPGGVTAATYVKDRVRSEERRVGKEWGGGGRTYNETKRMDDKTVRAQHVVRHARRTVRSPT